MCKQELDPVLSVAFLEQPDPMQQAMYALPPCLLLALTAGRNRQSKKPAATPETVIAVLQKYFDVLAQAHLFKSLVVQFFRQVLYCMHTTQC